MYQLLKLRTLAPAGLILCCFYFLLSFSAEASALPSPATGVMAQPTVPTPPPVIQLAIANSNGNAALSWIDTAVNEVHYVYRDTSPFFVVTNEKLIATIPAGTTTYEDTNSGIGNTSVNHFYKVTAWIGSDIISSNYVGEIDYPLKNASGAYSMVGIPFVQPSPSDAAGLAAQIGSVSNIYHWDPGTQSFRVFTPPDIDNFSFTYGESVFVQVGSGAAPSVSIVGAVDERVLSLYPNNYSFIATPLKCDEIADASDAAADITNVLNLLQWSLNFQSFLAFTPPDVGDDFALSIGAPFIVQLGANGPSTWPDTTSVCHQ